MYVADPRFTATYGGLPGAELVRDALHVWASTLEPGYAALAEAYDADDAAHADVVCDRRPRLGD
jgi:hypothetical protein